MIMVTGGTLEGPPYSMKECYEKAFELGPKDAVAWHNLGAQCGTASTGTNELYFVAAIVVT